MDGFQTQKTNIIVIGATNKSDTLDEALLRPGRFDCLINIPRPNRRGREEILKVHAKNYTLDANVDWEEMAKRTPEQTGADLANILNRAALIATKLKKNKIEMNDLEEARDWVAYGPARTTYKMNESEKRRVAVHEAGHTLMILANELASPL